MLVQPRPGRLRLFTQHDHGLASGALAAAWLGDGPLPVETMVAAALHDALWRRTDRSPRLDPGRGVPHDFTSWPTREKEALVERGVRRMEAVDPAVADVVREHHQALAAGREPGGPATWVRLFDVLSLFVCLTPPGSLEAARPPWLGSRVPRPDGRELALAWRSESELAVTPWPFHPPTLTLRLPFRDLEGAPWGSSGRLRAAWRQAPPRLWTPSLLPG